MTSITQTRDEEPMGPITGKTPIPLALVGMLLGAIIGWFVAGAQAYVSFDRRVTVIETQSIQLQRDLLEMKGDIKTLLRHQQ